MREFLSKEAAGKDPAAVVEEEFWQTSTDLMDRVFSAYTGEKSGSDPRFSKYVQHIRDGKNEGDLDIHTRDYADFSALRGIVLTLQYLFEKYKNEPRRFSGKLAVQHPVRVMEVLSQLYTVLPGMWEDLRSSQSKGEEKEIQRFSDTEGHPLRLWISALLHDVVENFFPDGKWTQEMETELREKLEDALLPVPGATPEDVEKVLDVLYLVTNPATIYPEGMDKDSPEGVELYLLEYESYLQKIVTSAEAGELAGEMALIIKLIDVLHNGSTEEIKENNTAKKEGKAKLVGQYILPHFPRLRWMASRSEELGVLFFGVPGDVSRKGIKHRNWYLWTEILKLPVPMEDVSRGEVGDVLNQ